MTEWPTIRLPLALKGAAAGANRRRLRSPFSVAVKAGLTPDSTAATTHDSFSVVGGTSSKAVLR
jgi:hypothetical protein